MFELSLVLLLSRPVASVVGWQVPVALSTVLRKGCTSVRSKFERQFTVTTTPSLFYGGYWDTKVIVVCSHNFLGLKTVEDGSRHRCVLVSVVRACRAPCCNAVESA